MSSNSYDRKFVKYVPVGYAEIHNTFFAYLFWILGFMGLHRFYLGRPLTGTIWFFTFGLLGIGWFIDLFLIPAMVRENNRRFQMGNLDYNVTWLLFWFGGLFGLHRFYQGKIMSGIVYLLTFGLLGIGWLFDLITLNEQINDCNESQAVDLKFASSW